MQNLSRKYYFMTIAETLNLTRAAEQLFVSQPSLTQYLNKLEAQLNVKLINREFSPLRLTQAGKVYYDYLKTAHDSELELMGKLDTIRQGSKAPLSIGMPLQKTHELTAAVLPQFLENHPNINISIWEGTSSTVKQRVIKGELEIGFGHTLTVHDADCVIEPLNTEKVVLICSADNPIVQGKHTSLSEPYQPDPQELSQQLFYQMAPEYYLYEVAEQQLRAFNVVPRHRLIMSNLHAIINSVAGSSNSGFAFMPDYVFNDERAKCRLSELGFMRLGSNDVHWMFSMMKKKNRRLTPEAVLFWNCVLSSVK